MLFKLHYNIKHYSFPYIWYVICCLFIIGLPYALYFSPIDYLQKESVRIMYIHVPASWLALLIYSLMGLGACIGLISKNSVIFIYIRSAATIGVIFNILSLSTGSIWGSVTWGTWWVWDARLTSMLVLCFLYIGYIWLNDTFKQQEYGYRISSLILILGLINIPIVKFSVQWWNTLHQGNSIIRADGPTICIEMLIPLIIMTSAFVSLAYALIILNADNILLNKKLQRIYILYSREVK